MKKTLIFVIALFMSSVMIHDYAFAIDENFFSSNDILFYDPTSGINTCSTTESTPSQPGSLDAFLQALAKQESGGNPTAANPGSSARGKYQYITSTWQSRWDLYPPASKYATADLAPEAAQDAVVYIEYAQKWNEFKGSIFKLAISHFYPAANSDESLLDQHIGTASNPTPREYADSVVDKVKNRYGSEIPLKYSEAPDFQKYLDLAVGDKTSFSGGEATESSSSVCSDGSADGGAVEEGGLTEEQAKILMMNYGENKGGDTERTIGASYWADCSPGGNGSNCVSFSRFFINKFSDTNAPTPMGNGVDVVNHMKAIGVPTGSAPKLFSVFSMTGSDSYGHTGVVLGIHGDTIIVGHASCGRGNDGIGGKGNGTLDGDGSGFILVGSISKKTGFYASGWPTQFAYPKVDTNKVQDYING